MIDLTIELDTRDLDHLLARLDAALDLDDVLDAAADLVLEHTLTRYMAQEDPDGNAWAPLAPATLKERAREGTGSQILYRTGTLFHSIDVQKGGVNQRLIGTEIGYGLYHQTGTGTMPQRMFLGISETDVDDVLDMLLTRVEGVLG